MGDACCGGDTVATAAAEAAEDTASGLLQTDGLRRAVIAGGLLGLSLIAGAFDVDPIATLLGAVNGELVVG